MIDANVAMNEFMAEMTAIEFKHKIDSRIIFRLSQLLLEGKSPIHAAHIIYIECRDEVPYESN